MPFLPTTSEARFPVGITTFVTPVRPSRIIGTAKRKNVEPRQPDPALLLEEVAFSVYYPADVDATSKRGVPWFLRPIREAAYGFATFLGFPSWVVLPIVYCFGSFLKIPAYPNAALLDPAKENKNAPNPKWPFVIFSHGLGGGRTIYSNFCTQLAASGKVVLAMEHRDGTGTVCMPRVWNNGVRSEPRTIYYLKQDEVLWEDGKDFKDVYPLPLRAQQLEFRHHEIHAAYSAFCRLLRNDPTLEIDTIDGSVHNRQSWVASSENGKTKVRTDKEVSLTGHSFGGCTMLHILSTEPSKEYLSIPVTRTVILDPWLEPLPSPGPAPLSTKTDRTLFTTENIATQTIQVAEPMNPRMLVINSEEFTVWKEHYERLREVVAKWEPQGGRIMTLVGSQHTSFSDFNILPVIGQTHAKALLDRIGGLALAFLEDKLDDGIAIVPTTELKEEIVGVKKDGKPKRRLLGNVGDVVVQ